MSSLKEIVDLFCVCNHKSMIDIFCSIYKPKVYLTGCIDHPKFNIWNRKNKIYESHSASKFGEIITDELITKANEIIESIEKKIKMSDKEDDDFLNDKNDQAKKLEKKKMTMMKAIKFLGLGKTSVFVEKYCCKHEDDFNKIIFNDKKGFIQYKNGQLNLKTGKIEQRTKDDFINECMDYDYVESSEVDRKKIESSLKIMFNNNQKDYDMMMSWIGYMMTGENNQRRFLVWYGAKGSNAKSTTFEILTKCYPVHMVEFCSETLKKDNSDRFRDLNNLTPNSRVIKIEELPEIKIDQNFLKKMVNNSGTTIQSRKFYDDKNQTVLINAVLNILTNEHIHVRPEPAIRARGLMFEVKTEFVDDKKKMINDLCFLKNEKYVNMYDEVNIKNAFTDILLEFTKDFYATNTIKHIDILKKQFDDFCDMNDTFKEFMEENFIFSETSRISKDRFMELYSLHSGKTKEFKYTSGLLKKYGLTYDKNTTCKGKRGVIFGIEEKENQDKEEEIDPLETEEEQIKAILSNKSLLAKLMKALEQQNKQTNPKPKKVIDDFKLLNYTINEDTETEEELANIIFDKPIIKKEKMSENDREKMLRDLF